MKVIILAGGGGSRLFPLSRQSYPKQFLCLEDDKSLLAHTVLRFLSFVSASDILVVTNQQYLYHVENELAECHAEEAHVVLKAGTKLQDIKRKQRCNEIESRLSQQVHADQQNEIFIPKRLRRQWKKPPCVRRYLLLYSISRFRRS